MRKCRLLKVNDIFGSMGSLNTQNQADIFHFRFGLHWRDSDDILLVDDVVMYICNRSRTRRFSLTP